MAPGQLPIPPLSPSPDMDMDGSSLTIPAWRVLDACALLPLTPPSPPPPSPQDGSSLTHIGLACIWRVLDAYALLPLNSMCRLLAQNGAVPRLFVVLKQVCVWGGGVRLGPCLASLWC